MKRIFSLICAILIVPSMVFAWAEGDPAKNVIQLFPSGGVTIQASGTSVFIIDTNSSMFGNRPGGDFGLQFSGASPAVGSASGGTINATWSGSERLPSGVSVVVGLQYPWATITSKLPSTTIVSGLNVLSGNTEYVYGFFTIDATRYIILKITAGIATLWNVQAYVKVD